MAVERKPLKKAPVRDVVDAFTSPRELAPDVETETPQEAARVTVASVVTADPPVRRGPGRPRAKRRMEPFSSKIEIGLRDDVDQYLADHDMTLVDLIDQALRERISK